MTTKADLPQLCPDCGSGYHPPCGCSPMDVVRENVAAILRARGITGDERERIQRMAGIEPRTMQ